MASVRLQLPSRRGKKSAAAPRPAVTRGSPGTVADFRAAVTSYEHLEDALARNRFNQRATAAALGLSYDQLRHALKRHKLQDTARLKSDAPSDAAARRLVESVKQRFQGVSRVAEGGRDEEPYACRGPQC